jgi:hypothetical protein
VSPPQKNQIVVVGKDGLSTEAQRNATVTFMALLRASLASKRVLKVRAARRRAVASLASSFRPSTRAPCLLLKPAHSPESTADI